MRVSQPELKMNAEINVITALVKYFEDSGVTNVFGFPGESMLPLYLAYNERAKIRHVMAGCERCAGYMADVYARISNQIGIVDAPGGIGSPWLMPSFSEAKNSSIPILGIVSGVSTDGALKWATGECDQLGMFKPFVKKMLRLEDPNRLYDFARQLIQTATSRRPGPTVLEIPTDLMQRPVDNSTLHRTSTHFPKTRTVPCESDLGNAVKIIKMSTAPIILAGGGVHLSRAYRPLADFSKVFNIPVVTTINGKGAIDEDSPLCVGVVGNKGSVENNEFVKKSDLIIVLGSKLGDKSTDNYTLFPKNARIIRIDIDESEIQRNCEQEIPLVGDISETLSRLATFDIQVFYSSEIIKEIAFLRARQESYYASYELPDMKVSPSLIIKEINSRFNGEAIICADASVASGWVGAVAKAKSDRRRIVTPRGTGSLGFGFPAAIAAKIAAPDLPVFGIGGDGGFAMSCHELETVRRLDLDIHYFVLNNNALGLLEKHLAREGYGDVLDKRCNTDWEKIAKGFGVNAVTLRSNKDVLNYFDKLPKGPSLVQVQINDDIIPPDLRTLLKSSLNDE